MIIAGSIPPISACFHAKTSLFCFKKMGKETSEILCKLGIDVGEVFRVIIQRYRLQLFRGLRSGVYLVAHVELDQIYVDTWVMDDWNLEILDEKWLKNTK